MHFFKHCYNVASGAVEKSMNCLFYVSYVLSLRVVDNLATDSRYHAQNAAIWLAVDV